jgi:hypothetical protein
LETGEIFVEFVVAFYSVVFEDVLLTYTGEIAGGVESYFWVRGCDF